MGTLRTWRNSAGLLLLGWLLLPSTLGAADDFLDAYKQGLEAIENQQWDLAAKKMREALAGRSEESSRLFKKGYLRKYLPHYYLGVALFELGDCVGALESWAESERQGVVNQRKVYEDLVDLREQCRARTLLADQIAPLERQLAQLDSEVARASSLQRDPALEAAWKEGSPSLAERQASASKELRQAKARLELARAQADPELLPGVEDLLAEARGELRAFEQQAESQRASRRSSSVAGAPKNQEGDVGRPMNPPRREVAPPPAELDAAVAAFLDGDYPQVIEILGDFSSPENHAMAHVHLLRSAALFALHRIRGNAELLSLARGEAAATRAAEPGLTLPKRFFSPRFHELFQSANSSDQED